jgi:translation initiation factor 2 beta subunit (eIF-2beta)/eIF-5
MAKKTSDRRIREEAASEEAKSLRNLQATIDSHATIETHLEAEAKWYKSIGDNETARAKQAEIVSERQRTINELVKNQNKLTDDQKALLKDLINKQQTEIKNEKEINAQLKKQKDNRQLIVNTAKDAIRVTKEGLKFLMEQDKIIKQTILNLGMSGTKADLMRGSFEKSAGFVASLGGTLEDVQKIMEGYADETGRARVLSAQMVQDIEAIGKGTGLGVEQATKLGAQFEYMGFDAKKTVDYVQGIVDTSERMGVNTTKVLKNLNDNFKKLNTFTFTKGSKAMAEMAMNAEKMHVDMADALNVAEATRGLENIIELTANLQVMGGKFAELDPYKALYMSRNEPEKWTEEISKMTRGIYTFKKMTDGTFEKFISPVDADRLRNVAKSLGISADKLFEIGQRRLELDSMNKDMANMGLTEKEKELVQGAAIFNAKSAKFQVMLAGEMRDISSLTADQAKSFAKEQVLLKDRAKEALTFDEAFKATINELKSALLPLLRNINDALKYMRVHILDPITKLSHSLGPWLTGAGLITAAVMWKGVTTGLEHVIQKWVSGGAGMGRSAVGAASEGGTAERVIGGGKRGAGKGMLKGGAGIGAAALGIGAGIGLAAVGISKLADSMSKLDKTQIWALPVTVLALAAAFAVFTPAIIAVGTAGEVSAIGLLALGAAVVGIGFGINLAGKGIGKMAEGLGTMFEKSKGSGKDMLMIAGGIAGIAAALALFNFSGLGLAAFAGVMGIITVASLATANVANSFAKMGIAMKGTKEDWIAVEQAITSIGKANFKGGGALTELANMLKNPLKVQFADKEVALNTYVTLDVNGTKFLEAVGATAHVQNNQSRAKSGLETIKHK